MDIPLPSFIVLYTGAEADHEGQSAQYKIRNQAAQHHSDIDLPGNDNKMPLLFESFFYNAFGNDVVIFDRRGDQPPEKIERESFKHAGENIARMDGCEFDAILSDGHHFQPQHIGKPPYRPFGRRVSSQARSACYGDP